MSWRGGRYNIPWSLDPSNELNGYIGRGVPMSRCTIGYDRFVQFKSKPVLEEVARMRRFSVLMATRPEGVLQAVLVNEFGVDWIYVGGVGVERYIVFLVMIPNIFEN